jgi:hypothetical protein
MVFLALICKKIYMLAPEKKGLAPELFLVLSTHIDAWVKRPLTPEVIP